jgi:flagella basal body P-ring formation protein FlgA
MVSILRLAGGPATRRGSAARTLAWLLAAAALAAAAVPLHAEGAAPVVTDAVADAIALAVAERVGGGAHAVVSKLQTKVVPKGQLVASPEPGARTGGPARFTLFAGGARLGSAVATVHVDARHVRATRALGRGDELAAGDIKEVNGPLRDQPIKRLPALQDVLGARLRRNVAAGEAITAAVIEVPAAVRSGDVVATVVRVGAVEAEGKAVVSGSGHVGDVVRVTPPGTRRPLKARVVGPGRVEIIQ